MAANSLRASMAAKAKTQLLRKSMSHRLNTPREDFEEWVGERLQHLKMDLVTECERIAVQRELNLKMEVERTHKEIERNRKEIERLRSTQEHPHSRLPAIFRTNTFKSRSSSEKKDDSLVDAVQQESNRKKDIEDGKALEFRLDPEEVLQPGRSAGAISFEDTAGVSDVKTTNICIDSGGKEEMLASAPSASSSAFAEAQLQPAVDNVVANESELGQESQESLESQDHFDFYVWAEWKETVESAKSKHGISNRVPQGWEDSQLETAWLRGNPNIFESSREITSSWTISPNSTMALSWDFLGIPVLLYDLITLPLQVFWEHEGDLGTAIQSFITAYWTADIFLRSFVIGYIENSTNEIQLDRKSIMRNYFKNSFAFDAILVIPDWISLIFQMPRNFALLRIFRTMRFLRLTRMQKLRQIARKLQDLLDSESFSVYINVSWNVLLMMSCCHYIACFWYWVGTTETEGYDSWVKFWRLEDNPDWQFHYLTSLHWALCQFTPGSMTVSAVNIIERITSIIVQLWGIVVFSLFVSNLTQERLRLQSFSKKMDRDNWLLRRYMKQNRVSRGLALRAVKYVDSFVAPALTRVQRSDVALLNSLSRPLQLEIQAEIYFHTLLANPFFWKLNETSFTMASNLFADAVAEMSLARNDLLFEVGQVSHEMFMVSHGVVGYLHAGTNRVVAIGTQQWCCEQVLWVPWIHKGTARAAGESFLLSVDSSKFRTEVLEFRERSFVRSCAQAYLQDLLKCVEDKVEINDLIRMHEQKGEFVSAYSTECVKEDGAAGAEVIIKSAEHFL